MKKYYIVMLIAFLILGVTGCGSNKENKAIIIKNDGTKEEINTSEVLEIGNNEAKFLKYYVGAQIEFDGTVNKVEVKSTNCYKHYEYGLKNIYKVKNVRTGATDADKSACAVIYFDDGFEVAIPSAAYDVSEISNGDSYHVKTNLININNKKVLCFGIEYNEGFDEDLIEFYATKLSKK